MKQIAYINDLYLNRLNTSHSHDRDEMNIFL